MTTLKPIVLFVPKRTLETDDACTTIHQYPLAPAPSAVRPPYQQPFQSSPHNSTSLRYVPPLCYFCIRHLFEYPQDLHALGPACLPYSYPTKRDDFDIIQALIPSYRPFSLEGQGQEPDLRLMDPRLWATLVQIYDGLPPVFRTYTLPLSDPFMPLLQKIPSTEHFSLITTLTLRGCSELTDDTAIELRHLHTLVALDASGTALGTLGMRRLAKSLSWGEGDDLPLPERRGLWNLRVLYLRNCINTENGIFGLLPRFPLLSVVGEQLMSTDR